MIAYSEEFRDLRDPQPTSQLNDASIGLLNDADPAFHGPTQRKTHATAYPFGAPEGVLSESAAITAGSDVVSSP